jgi:hypothetical protein
MGDAASQVHSIVWKEEIFWLFTDAVDQSGTNKLAFRSLGGSFGGAVIILMGKGILSWLHGCAIIIIVW